MTYLSNIPMTQLSRSVVFVDTNPTRDTCVGFFSYSVKFYVKKNGNFTHIQSV